MMFSSLDKESHLSVAIHLNNGAAFQISQGEYSGAAATLSTAFVTLKEAIKIIKKSGNCSPSREEGTTTNTNEDSPLHFVASQQQYDPPSTTTTTNINNTNNKSKVSDDWYHFEDPVRVCAEKVLPSSDCMEIISYAMIYNLGLCHHSKAQQFNSESTMHLRYLQRAVSCYSHAQKLVSSPSLHDVGMLHSLVVANNLGHAHHFLNNEQSSRLCLRRLLNVIVLIKDSGQQGRQIVSKNERYFDGFLTNIMHLVGFCSATPAA
jgi:hypothetical protein